MHRRSRCINLHTRRMSDPCITRKKCTEKAEFIHGGFRRSIELFSDYSGEDYSHLDVEEISMSEERTCYIEQKDWKQNVASCP